MKIKDTFVDVHADDYGYSLNTSKEILDCVINHGLNSFSLLPNMASFDESIGILYKNILLMQELPLISIHINLVEGFSYNGELIKYSWYKLFFQSYFFGYRKTKENIKKEIKYQIEKSLPIIENCIKIANDNGIKVKQKKIRIDSHMHTHLIPIVWNSLIEVIKENGYEIEYIRNPKEPIGPFVENKTYNFVNLIKNRVLMLYSIKVDKWMDENGLKKMYMWGLSMSGNMNYDDIIKTMPSFIKYVKKDRRNFELLFHPGISLLEEKNKDMNEENFYKFNNSLNRKIEKKSIEKINDIWKEI